MNNISLDEMPFNGQKLLHVMVFSKLLTLGYQFHYVVLCLANIW